MFDNHVQVPTDGYQYEWNPFEFGSWDVGFTPTRYVGSVPNAEGKAEKCVENLDSAR